jgi:hypothetical protein
MTIQFPENDVVPCLKLGFDGKAGGKKGPAQESSCHPDGPIRTRAIASRLARRRDFSVYSGGVTCDFLLRETVAAVHDVDVLQSKDFVFFFKDCQPRITCHSKP